jgi:indole-3-glycerol phosphate synthase
MPDLLDKLVDDATRRITSGYYDIGESVQRKTVSLTKAIKSAKNNAIIAEIKPASPSRGQLRREENVVETALSLTNGGAVALSILTEPDNFGGSIKSLQRIRNKVNVPLLMKDIIISDTQIHAGAKSGADSILLIESIFSKHRSASLEAMIDEAHRNQLEVILEAHTKIELEAALQTKADVVGINNRNLATLQTDINTTKKLLSEIDPPQNRILISESGFETAEDIRKVKAAPVVGFLIGSSIMLSSDAGAKVREFVYA